MSFATDKAALVALVKTKNCDIAAQISAAASYDALLPFLFQEAGVFDCDTAYLNAVFSIFPDAELTSRNVYFNKLVAGATVTNPVAVINCTYDEIIINPGVEVPLRKLEIMLGSVIQKITVTNTSRVWTLTIGGGSVVNLLDVISGSCVDVLLVKSCDPIFSTLDKIEQGSCVDEMGIDTGSTFNGYTCSSLV